MFYFTVIMALAYTSALAALFRSAGPNGITAFPDFDAAMVALLGISNVGYLLYKSIPRA